jgi:uncharacterized sulfatase
LYTHQIGIRGNEPVVTKGAKPSPNNPEGRDLWVKMRNRITEPMAQYPSFIKELKAHGYATLQTGRWWEGNPLEHGFTDAMTHGDPTRGGRHGDMGLAIGRSTMQPIYYFVDKAEQRQQPFFVCYGVYLPHFPHNAPTRLFNKYKDIAPDEPTAWYWANVEWLDETCGQLVDYLKVKGLYENTIFVYTCDNGWVQNPKVRSRSIRSKNTPLEAGIRTPIFVTHVKTFSARLKKDISQ